MRNSKKIILGEVLGFSGIIGLLWADEILDLPHIFWGAAKTPVNWQESAFESLMVSLLAIVIIAFTRKSLKRIRTLSGLLPICASCKKIRDDKGYWKQIESYVREHSEAEFSHGICPECARKYYPDYNLYDSEETES